LLDLISRVSAAHRSFVGEIATEVLDHIPEVQALHRLERVAVPIPATPAAAAAVAAA